MSATTETNVGSISGVFDDDAFEQIGDVFTAVGGGYEEVEDLRHLDYRNRIALLIEELDDGVLMDAVCLMFELLDTSGHFEDAVPPLESGQCRRDPVDRVADDVNQSLRAGADVHDLVETNT